MQKNGITCDSCGKDLTSTGNCEDYRISLSNERIPSRGGAVTLMAVYAPLDHTAHFCGLNCLGEWASKKMHPFTGRPIIPNKHPDHFRDVTKMVENPTQNPSPSTAYEAILQHLPIKPDRES